MSRKIAVLVQAYNEEKFISETIQSILNQSFKDFDLIISDNHSTDATLEIATEYAARDSRIVLWRPPAFCRSLEHAKYIIDKVNGMHYESSIFVGAHDLLTSRYIELLHAAHQENPNAAIVVGCGSEIDLEGNFLRNWPNVMEMKGGHISSRPLTIITNLYYNLPAWGLWPKKIRTDVKFRHNCMGGDHLYIAEAALHGDIIVEKNALLKSRRTVGVGEHETYFKKHISDDMRIATVVEDFNRQLEWLCHINRLTYGGFSEATRNITLAGWFGIYFSLFGMTMLRSVDGALQAWLESPMGLTVASQMNSIGTFIHQNYTPK